MHPIHNEERRRSTVQRLQSSILQKQGVVYAYAAAYPEGHYAAVVVSDKGEIISSCSVRHSSPEETEMAAIALAITNPATRIIITDSKTAIKAYYTGKVSKEAAKVLQAGKENVPNDLISIICAPAHIGLTKCEIANEVVQRSTLMSRTTERRARDCTSDIYSLK